MSRIFEALLRSEAIREQQADVEIPMDLPRRFRRSLRWPLHSVIHVYGHMPGCSPFYKAAQTVNVSVNGALLLLDVPLEEGQNLLLINPAIEEPQVCKLVHISRRGSASFEMGVEFSAPRPEFWKHLRSAKPVKC